MGVSAYKTQLYFSATCLDIIGVDGKKDCDYYKMSLDSPENKHHTRGYKLNDFVMSPNLSIFAPPCNFSTIGRNVAIPSCHSGALTSRRAIPRQIPTMLMMLLFSQVWTLSLQP